MYLRFQGRVPNVGTPNQLGIFQLAFELRDSGGLPNYAYCELVDNLEWLKRNLVSPRVLDEPWTLRAVCWFKSDAHEPISRIWSIKAVLDDWGHTIDLVKSESPGQIIFEDDWQVAALPWRGRSPRRQRRPLRGPRPWLG